MSDQSFSRLATSELVRHGTDLGDAGDAARDRARTWAILALAQATEHAAMVAETEQPTTESETP